jgi:hypothetical protein
MQRIYEWRGNFGSTAISVINAFFSMNKDFDENDARVAFSQEMLRDLRFQYSTADGDDSSVSGHPKLDLLLTLHIEISRALPLGIHSQNLGPTLLGY